jgi:hypothetical protein
MASLFGFSIDDSYKSKAKGVVSPVPENNEDGADYFLSSGFYGQYLDIEGVFKTEYDLIRRYREMSLHPEVDGAIEDIISEAIVSDLNDSPVQLELSNLNVSDKLKEIVRAEFQYIKDLLDFDKKAHEIFRNWYVDGRVYYHKVIDLDNPQEGIKELRYIDSLKIKFVREQKKSKTNTPINLLTSTNTKSYEFPGIEEYFVFSPNSSSNQTSVGGVQLGLQQRDNIKIAKDAIAYCTSGLVDRNKYTVLSYLHKAIKALNQLRMIEDAIVIYRLSRAPERRIFYIDVGNLPKVKAEQYLREVMSRYRNKLSYDASTGEIRDDKRYMSMLEDFWLPRREGGRGTEITTLPGGQNLGELTDVEYFQKKLYRALGVPESRLSSGDGFNLGRSSDILRDELKFSKFVGRMRKRFSNIFHDILRSQLILKNIVTPEEWDQMSDHIQYDYLYDNHFAELKNVEIMQERMGVLAAVDPYVGKYFSLKFVRQNILRQTDGEMLDIDYEINSEREAGLIPPTEMEMMQMQMDQQAAMAGQPAPSDGGALGQIPQDPALTDAKTGTESPSIPKGGEI